MANDLNCVFIVGRLTRDMDVDLHQRRHGYWQVFAGREPQEEKRGTVG